VIVHYAEEAERDLDDIASYTAQVWSVEHRDSYIEHLQTVCERVLPEHWRRIARPYEHPAYPGVLQYRSESHVIYFREVPDGLEILTIRHVRRAPLNG
jgi:toxin ParE1/3/4